MVSNALWSLMAVKDFLKRLFLKYFTDQTTSNSNSMA